MNQMTKQKIIIILGLKVYKNQKLLLVIYGLYLPYENHTLEQMELYMETLDNLKSLMESTVAQCPMLIVGDMNTSLPTSETLDSGWYKKHPFSKRSLILYDFLCENSLLVGNFCFDQQVPYTYLKNNITSYIDHVFISEYAIDYLQKCSTMLPEAGNVSDHLPLTITVDIRTPKLKPEANFPEPRVFPRPAWTDPGFKTSYILEVKKALRNPPFRNLQSYSADEVKQYINQLCDGLCTTLHQCVETCLQQQTRNKKCKSKPWWNTECFKAKQRNSVFYQIWKECGRPTSGLVFDNYKCAKSNYRKVCRLAMNDQIKLSQHTIGTLFHTNKPSQMWNLIRKIKSKPVCNDAISMETLFDFFKNKFSALSTTESEIHRAEQRTNEKYTKLSQNCNITKSGASISLYSIKRYIKMLKNNCSPGLDGITAEHLKYAANTKLPLYLSHILTLCIEHGTVPNSFRHGVLIPILKKSTLNPSEAKNYRPITVSVTFSKLLELYTLEECSDHQFSPFQFGFISNRSTQMAASLAHDILEYGKSQGSPAFLCSLDAEGAFDPIPFSILFDCADVLPNKCWRFMFNWYHNINICLKWRGKISPPIKVNTGIHQGGLSSPMLFNLFYQNLISELNSLNIGIIINNQRYNALCYADDILLISTTVTGLQKLIDKAVSHITKKGLKFNPLKTECFIAGKNPFVSIPKWFIGNSVLSVKDKIKYLGTVLGNSNGLSHVQERISNSNKAFHSLQGAGLYKNVTDPHVAVHIYKTAVRSGLLYGCSSISLSKSNADMLERTQGKHIKTILGLNYNTHSTKLLQAIGTATVKHSIQASSLDLVASCLYSSSAARPFYFYLYKYKMFIKNTLIHRASEYCHHKEINLLKFALNKKYKLIVKQTTKQVTLPGADGIVDTINSVLVNYCANGRTFLNNLLKAF